MIRMVDGITMTIGDPPPLVTITTIVEEEEDGTIMMMMTSHQQGDHPDETLDRRVAVLIMIAIGDHPRPLGVIATLEEDGRMTIMKIESRDEILDPLVLIADDHRPTTGTSFEGVATTILDGRLPTGAATFGVVATIILDDPLPTTTVEGVSGGVPIRIGTTVDNSHPVAALHEAIIIGMILPSTSHVPSI
jgi:hypothetical protein